MRKRIPISLVLAAALPLLVACLFFGAFGIGLPDLGTDTGRTIFFQLRLLRVLTGFLVGAGLSCAGVVFQALLRNPLAEPYVLGVSSGGAVGAAVAILCGFSAVSAAAIPGMAFVTAALTLLLVYALATQNGTASVYGLVLSGVIVSALASSLLMFLISQASAEGLHSIMWWMLGNLQAESPALLLVSGVAMSLSFVALWWLAPELNALTLGSEMAHYLGIRTKAVIVSGLLLATLMTATAVGLAGLIGFVGLVVPHAVRHLVGPDHRRLFPAAAIGGGVFLAVCDALARSVLGAVEIPVGVITAFVGGPFFLIVLRRRRKGGWIA
jgi:iron complex transport system permease protein